MPSGKVKWFDADKGFGFLSQDDGPDVYVHADALPEGMTTIKNGTRVEFGIAQGRRGDQALQVRVVDAPPSVARNKRNAQRKDPEQMVTIVEDLIRLLDERRRDLPPRPAPGAPRPPRRRRSCCARWPTSSSSDASGQASARAHVATTIRRGRLTNT